MFPDVRLFRPEVRYGGRVVRSHADVVPLGLGDALRARILKIAARPSLVGWRPPGNRGGDEVWHQVRRHHHEAFGASSVERRPDERHIVALKFGVAEVVVEALFAPVYGFLSGFDKRLARIAALAHPADRDFWAPRRRRS